VLSSPQCILGRTPAAGIRNGRRQLAGAYVISIQAHSDFTVDQANHTLATTFDASAARDPIEFDFAPESRPDAIDFLPPTPASSAVSIQTDPHSSYRFREGDSASVSAAVVALEDAHTDADLFEPICQIPVPAFMVSPNSWYSYS
jgi:hypothetical protein